MLERIAGVRIVNIEPHADQRGAFTEVFRSDWKLGCNPVQWNLDHSVAGTLRGLHAHKARYDYLTLVWGRMFLALHDARPQSSTFGLTLTADLSPSTARALILPPGVAHGFYYPEDSAVLIGFTVAWDPSDDIRCHYLAPELGIRWPGPVEHISPSDASAPGYRDFLHALA
ncbi:MAG: dTDP-4-dehydrorhamnose 3,5-epimerase family protein [Chromatiales bacterium]|jgi:dTDP-4-dehydrorhamnose 3,5-epimerase